LSSEYLAVDLLPAHRRLLVQMAQEHGFVPDVAAHQVTATAGVAAAPAPTPLAGSPPGWPPNILVAWPSLRTGPVRPGYRRCGGRRPPTRHRWLTLPIGQQQTAGPSAPPDRATIGRLWYLGVLPTAPRWCWSTRPISTTSLSHPGPPPGVTFGAGVTIDEATSYLQNLDNYG